MKKNSFFSLFGNRILNIHFYIKRKLDAPYHVKSFFGENERKVVKWPTGQIDEVNSLYLTQ